ncbi:MAG TPA: SUMF1/EgtB/PvdO family nonheme iron enzyme [Opitutaceae bacterium]
MGAATAAPPESYVTTNGIEMVLIRADTYEMGNALPTDAATLGQQGKVFTHGGEDERPVRRVTISYDFYISETEVPAAKFTKYQEDHESTGLFHPFATGISWEDAVGFTEWMNRNEDDGYRDEANQLLPKSSQRTGAGGAGEARFYRLPTEAEWEYVARAGSAGHFSSGDLPPASGEANTWGVKNMHTDALEWVLDWHGDYPDRDEVDPLGPASGVVRVVRGGGLNMPYHDFSEKYPVDGRMPFYRRSANRAGAPPEWRGRHNIGFRIVAAPLPSTPPRAVAPKSPMQFVRQKNPWVAIGPDPAKPWFRRRDALPIPSSNSMNRDIAAAGLHHTVHGKNHNPALVVLPNGDLLATYFSASAPEYEDLTDVSIIGTRLRFGADEWDMPGPFFDIPGAKDIGPVLTLEGDRILFACGGGGLDGILFRWQTSDDNGATWGPLLLPVIIGRRGDYFPQPISNFLRGADGTLYMPTDGSGGSTVLWASRDDGVTWHDTGGRTGGRHTVFVNRRDRAILGMGGKATEIDGYMPRSISRDGGRTWEVSKTQFPFIGPGGQRPAFIRLASGRLFFAADWLNAAGEQPPGINKTGAYVALSDDEGETWIVKDIPDLPPIDRWLFRGRPGYRESPLKDGTLGYCMAAQAPNGVIHLLNSSTQPPLHFEMNEAWILDSSAPSTQLAASGAGEVRTTREDHPDGSKKAEWSVRPDASGRMLLHGTETHWYPSGAKEYEVTWADGAKTGVETNWDQSGRVVWTREHRADGTTVWTQFRTNGTKHRESTWRGKRADGPAREWDGTGRLIAEHEFKEGEETGR